MEKRTLAAICAEIDVWDNWRESYGKYVPLFIKEAATGANWSAWDEDVFHEYFMRSSLQCVSSLKQGYFTYSEKDAIKEHWNEIAPLLQKIALEQETPQYDVYQRLKDIITNYTSQDRRAATNRMIASLQPQLLCTIVNQKKLGELFDLLKAHVDGFNLEWKPSWFENSYQILQLFKQALNTDDAYQIMTYPWQVYEEYDFTSGAKTPNNDMSENKTAEITTLLKYKKQIILQGPPGTGKTRLAEEIAQQLTDSTENYKVVQFHPSYTYEDFVRGIVAKPNPDGEGIIYEPENKVLTKLAKEAFENYKNVQHSEAEHIPVEEQAKSKLDRFITHVIEIIDKEEKYQISDNVYIFYVDDKRFKYKGDNWGAHPKGLNMNFSELEKIIASGISERADIVKLNTLNALTRSHATYYANIMEKFNEFIPKNVMPEPKKTQLKNYVLIIDEINRANLSSVLGELIYTLEYRGKPVDSMYETNGEKRLVLPPNFYIIGTMNTADRSVGHIDYAIRRRFAFVDVLPEVLEENEEIYFNTEHFSKVTALFNRNNVSAEFEVKDVQIGHSYFIVKKEDNPDEYKKQEIFNLKMIYEVIPILKEYVKDGILVGSIEGKSVTDYIDELKPGVA